MIAVVYDMSKKFRTVQELKIFDYYGDNTVILMTKQKKNQLFLHLIFTVLWKGSATMRSTQTNMAIIGKQSTARLNTTGYGRYKMNEYN